MRHPRNILCSILPAAGNYWRYHLMEDLIGGRHRYCKNTNAFHLYRRSVLETLPINVSPSKQNVVIKIVLRARNKR
jgi:hypothetical protein